MNSISGRQLQKLARIHQHRIWLQKVWHRALYLKWFLVCIIFSGGLIHQLLYPLDPIIIVSIALIPGVLIFSWLIIINKPGLEESAAGLDSLLTANSLFVSAWELSRAANVTKGTGQLLLARAEKLLANWSEHTIKQPRQEMKPASFVAITLLLMGLFLLFSTSQVQTSPITATSLNDKQDYSNTLYEPEKKLSEVFRESIKQSIPAPEQQANANHAPAPATSTPDSQLSEGDSLSTAKISDQNLEKTQQPISAHVQLPAIAKTSRPSSIASQGKKTADRTAGNESGKNAKSLLKPGEQFEHIRQIDIKTDVDSQSMAFDNSPEGHSLIISPTNRSALAEIAGNQTGQAALSSPATLLHAEQRVMVRRYFKQLEKIDDSNP